MLNVAGSPNKHKTVAC